MSLGVSEEAERLDITPLYCSHGEWDWQIGVFVVSNKAKHMWVEEKVEIWVEGVKRLAGFSIM